MTDYSAFDDTAWELASAYLDGEASVDERAQVDASPELLGLVAELRAITGVLTTDVAPPASDVRDSHITRAVAASERLAAVAPDTNADSPVSAVSPVSLDAVRAAKAAGAARATPQPRRTGLPRWLLPVGIAAGLLLFVGVLNSVGSNKELNGGFANKAAATTAAAAATAAAPASATTAAAAAATTAAPATTAAAAATTAAPAAVAAAPATTAAAATTAAPALAGGTTVKATGNAAELQDLDTAAELQRLVGDAAYKVPPIDQAELPCPAPLKTPVFLTSINWQAQPALVFTDASRVLIAVLAVRDCTVLVAPA